MDIFTDPLFEEAKVSDQPKKLSRFHLPKNPRNKVVLLIGAIVIVAGISAGTVAVLRNRPSASSVVPPSVTGCTVTSTLAQAVTSLTVTDANCLKPSVASAGTGPYVSKAAVAGSGTGYHVNDTITIPIKITNNNTLDSTCSPDFNLVVNPPTGWSVVGFSNNVNNVLKVGTVTSGVVKGILPGKSATIAVTLTAPASAATGTKIYIKVDQDQDESGKLAVTYQPAFDILGTCPNLSITYGTPLPTQASQSGKVTVPLKITNSGSGTCTTNYSLHMKFPATWTTKPTFTGTGLSTYTPNPTGTALGLTSSNTLLAVVPLSGSITPTVTFSVPSGATVSSVIPLSFDLNDVYHSYNVVATSPPLSVKVVVALACTNPAAPTITIPALAASYPTNSKIRIPLSLKNNNTSSACPTLWDLTIDPSKNPHNLSITNYGSELTVAGAPGIISIQPNAQPVTTYVEVTAPPTPIVSLSVSFKLFDYNGNMNINAGYRTTSNFNVINCVAPSIDPINPIPTGAVASSTAKINFNMTNHNTDPACPTSYTLSLSATNNWHFTGIGSPWSTNTPTGPFNVTIPPNTFKSTFVNVMAPATGSGTKLGITLQDTSNPPLSYSYQPSLAFTPVAAPLNIPQGLYTDPGNTTMLLHWSLVTGATGYNIYRSTTTGTETIRATSSINQFNDTGLANGTKYFYQVRATTATSQSDISAEATGTTIAIQSLLATPQGLYAVPGDTKNSLFWSFISNATGYNIYRSTTTGTETIRATSSINQFNDTGLANGTKYFYQVRATTATSQSGISAEATGTPVGTVTGGGTTPASPVCTVGHTAVGLSSPTSTSTQTTYLFSFGVYGSSCANHTSYRVGLTGTSGTVKSWSPTPNGGTNPTNFVDNGTSNATQYNGLIIVNSSTPVDPSLLNVSLQAP